MKSNTTAFRAIMDAQAKLAVARLAGRKRRKREADREKYADPVYREAINERQRMRRGK